MPTVAEALKLGLQKHQAGELAAAEQIYWQILEQQPNYPNALHLLGVLVTQTARPELGVGLLKQAVALDPSRALYHGNLGWAYFVCGRHEEAIAALERAVQLNPNFPDAHYNAGRANHALQRLDEAEASFRRCLQIQADRADAHANLGAVLQDMGRLAEAQRCHERAIDLKPHTAAFHHNLGTVLQSQGQLTDAIKCYDQALSIEPDYAPSLALRGVVLLSQGDFAAGWAGYEHRAGCPGFDPQKFPEPLWDGSPLAGRTLVIRCEQGLGDTLQFIRYVKLIKADDGAIIVATQSVLIPLLTQSGYTGLIAKGETLPAMDVYAPLMSLPRIFRTELDSVPRDVPYLSVERERVSTWGEHLKKYVGLKVGIAWRGDKGYRFDQFRSIPLESFAPLAQVPTVRLFSLQKGQGSEELTALGDRFAVVDLGGSLDNVDGAFLDTAAVMKNLDLIVTCDTAIGHLAGALGVPVWVALPQLPDWRWMLDRTDSPWYPTMRLFRQSRAGDWDGMFDRMRSVLADIVNGAAPISG